MTSKAEGHSNNPAKMYDDTVREYGNIKVTERSQDQEHWSRISAEKRAAAVSPPRKLERDTGTEGHKSVDSQKRSSRRYSGDSGHSIVSGHLNYHFHIDFGTAFKFGLAFGMGMALAVPVLIFLAVLVLGALGIVAR